MSNESVEDRCAILARQIIGEAKAAKKKPAWKNLVKMIANTYGGGVSTYIGVQRAAQSLHGFYTSNVKFFSTIEFNDVEYQHMAALVLHELQFCKTNPTAIYFADELKDCRRKGPRKVHATTVNGRAYVTIPVADTSGLRTTTTHNTTTAVVTEVKKKPGRPPKAKVTTPAPVADTAEDPHSTDFPPF
jgi:hypothetical protein